MTWADVFNGTKSGAAHRTPEEAAIVAWQWGYKFITWNADIFLVLDNKGATAETGLRTMQLYNRRPNAE